MGISRSLGQRLMARDASSTRASGTCWITGITLLCRKCTVKRLNGRWASLMPIRNPCLLTSTRMMKHLLQTELDYTIWANQTLLQASSALTVEEIGRNLGASHGSVIRTLRHIYDAESLWTHNLIAHSIPSVAEIE